MQTISLNDLLSRVPALSTEQPHPDVSDKYVFIKSADVVDNIMNLGWEPVTGLSKKNRNAVRKTYGKHGVTFRNPALTFNVNSNDSIISELVFINSHDRTNTFRFYASVYRTSTNTSAIIPANVLSTVENTYLSIRHIHYNIEQLESTVKDLIQVLSNNVNIIKTLANSQISDAGEREFIMKAMLRRSLVNPEDFGQYMNSFPDQTIEVIQIPELEQEIGTTAWDVFMRTHRKMEEGFIAFDPIRKRVAKFKPINNFERRIDLSANMYSDFMDTLKKENITI